MTTKNYSIVPLLITVIGILTSCSNKNDWKEYGLNGKIKTYLERHYEAEMKFGDWENGDIYYGHNKVLFDKNGNYQWIEYRDEETGLYRKRIPKREKGKLIEESFYDEDGELISKTKVIHNSNDELESVDYDEDGEIASQGKSFFKNNRIIKHVFRTFKNNKIEDEYSTIFEYDKDGNVIREKLTDKKGELIYCFKFKYLSFDDNSNWTKRLDYVDYDSEEGDEPDKIVTREYEYY